MKIQCLKKGDENSLDNFLLQFAETSMFLRSNAHRAGLEYHGQEYQGEYLGAFCDQGNLCGVLAHYWNGNIMMQAEDVTILNQLIARFRMSLSRPVAGVIGANEQVLSVIQGLDLLTAQFNVNRGEGLYVLDLNSLQLPIHSEQSCYEMVTANNVKRDILKDWIKGYEIEAFGAGESKNFEQHIESRVDQMKQDDCWALLVSGNPVCLSGFNARLPDIVQIGPVWTPPEHRSKGYARCLVALTLQNAKQQGVQKSILFTDNLPAIKAYEAIGFEKCGSYRLSILKEPIILNST